MMKPFALCVGVLALMVALAPDASAQTVRLKATLTGGEETPILNTGAVGTAEVNVDTVNQELEITLRVFNIPTATTGAHIHVGPKSITGPVVIDFPAAITGRTGDFAMVFRVGAGQLRARTAIGINTMEDAIQAIINENAYINIHTRQFPAGEIRGQLTLAN